MIKLYQFPRMKNFPNMSPYCVKLETYLKISQLPYQSIPASDTRKAPKKKFPYIVDGDVEMGDSTLIIDYLKNKYGDKVDTHLSTEQQAISLAFQRQIEEYMVLIGVYFRWIDEAAWQSLKPQIFAKMPLPLKFFVPNMVRKQISEKVLKHGVGAHTREELLKILRKDLKGLSTFLGDKKYFWGNEVSSIDASAFGILGNMAYDLVENGELKKAIDEYPNLLAYAQRMKAQYFP